MLHFDSDRVGLTASMSTGSGEIRICIAVSAVMQIRAGQGLIEMSADEGDRLAAALTLAGASAQIHRPFNPVSMTFGAGYETRVMVREGEVHVEHLPPGQSLELIRFGLSGTEAVDLAAALAAICVSLRALYVLLGSDCGA